MTEKGSSWKNGGVGTGKVGKWDREEDGIGWVVGKSKSDDEMSKEGIIDENGGMHKSPNVEEESDLEEVAEALFEKEQSPANMKADCIGVQKGTHSEDLFNIYELLNKNKDNNNGDLNSNDNLKYPPGFSTATDEDIQNNPLNELDVEGDAYVHNVQDHKVESVAKKNSPFDSSKNDTDRSVCSGHFKICKILRSGGSILQLMDELIKVGQIMGYNMEGCMKNIVNIIDSQGVNDGNR